MGSGWVIQSFDRARWDDLFGGGLPGAEQKLLDAMLSYREGYFDDYADELRPGPHRERILASPEGQQARALASHLARNGFTYAGLSASQSVRLDRLACSLRVDEPEGFGNILDVKGRSSDFYPATTELLYRVGLIPDLWQMPRRDPLVPPVPVRLLPLLLTGRRFGTDAEPTKSEGAYYVILSPAEVAEMRDEVVAAINVPIAWANAPYDPEMTEEFLLAPLAEIAKSGRWGALTYLH
jgi:hypothetical protein